MLIIIARIEEGYYNCCDSACSCGEQNCPSLCLCIESFLCNSCAVSASRMYVMERYELQSDPCDYRLIRINNCIQILACVCNVLAIFIDALRPLANLLNYFADLMYHCISGCMTAQVTGFHTIYVASINHAYICKLTLFFLYLYVAFICYIFVYAVDISFHIYMNT